MDEVNTKTLPIDLESTSKAYITYNPSNIDITPVSSHNRTSIEPPERILSKKDKVRYRRQHETPEQRAERLRKDREKKRLYRARIKQDESYDEILEKNRIVMRLRRQNESYRERERERDRIRHQIRRADVEFRSKEKVKERGRKRLSRFLKKYAERFSALQTIAEEILKTQRDVT